MRDAAKQPGKWLKIDEKRPSYQGRTFARDHDAFPWHETLCLQQADDTSFRALTSWIVISLLVAAFAAGLAASGAATMTSVVTLAFAGLASLYFGYLECLKLIARSCNGRRM
jgi:hypothetical protein